MSNQEIEFPEMTPNQRKVVKNYLIETFDKRYNEIPESLSFMNGASNKMEFGKFILERTEVLFIKVYSVKKASYGSSKMVVSDYGEPLTLPPT